MVGKGAFLSEVSFKIVDVALLAGKISGGKQFWSSELFIASKIPFGFWFSRMALTL